MRRFGFGAALSATPTPRLAGAPVHGIRIGAGRCQPRDHRRQRRNRAVLEYMKKLSQFMSDTVYAWDDASNNRWMLSGRGSAVINPPSPWAVAKRDAPELAPLIWHHDLPAGPRGRFRHLIPNGWGVWHFSPNKQAAKDLLRHMASARSPNNSSPRAKDTRRSFRVVPRLWRRRGSGPPAGTLYNYTPARRRTAHSCGTPAPNDVAAQIFTQGVLGNLVSRVTADNESFDDAIYWAENELEGFVRR